jgi:hypothetical protein
MFEHKAIRQNKNNANHKQRTIKTDKQVQMKKKEGKETNSKRNKVVTDIKENSNRYEKQDSANNMFYLFYQIIYDNNV